MYHRCCHIVSINPTAEFQWVFFHIESMKRVQTAGVCKWGWLPVVEALTSQLVCEVVTSSHTSEKLHSVPLGAETCPDKEDWESEKKKKKDLYTQRLASDESESSASWSYDKTCTSMTWAEGRRKDSSQSAGQMDDHDSVGESHASSRSLTC